MQIDNHTDFLERFTALENERRSLAGRLSATRAGIRATRTASPKRWWSRERKKAFADEAAARRAELEKTSAEISVSLSKIDNLVQSLREKEKKSHQSYLFLSKLANFVEFIGRDDFWSAQIVQIVVSGTATATDQWHEPRLELVPRAGNHTIVLGELNGTERRRLENLRLFYLKGLWHEGWDAYDRIDIEYENQIVCTK